MLKTIILMLTLFTSLYVWENALADDAAHEVTISRNGMTVQISRMNEIATIDISAPIKGWFLLGLNYKEGLQNARLFFARISDNFTEIEEHRTDFSYPAPFHKIMQNNSNLINISGGGTTSKVNRAIYQIPMQGKYAGQVDLGESCPIYVTLAYSNENDFDHHSAMRTSVKIDWKGSTQ